MKCFLPLLLLLAGRAQAQLASSGSAVSAAEAQAALDQHNKYRALVGVTPLRWSEPLAIYAQAWADQLAKDCKIRHRPLSGQWEQKFGENIFWGNGQEYTALDATASWYSEKKDFRYGPVTERNYMRVGHYTQQVWSSTTQVGIGKARCADGTVVIVANYDPRGNYIGVKPY